MRAHQLLENDAGFRTDKHVEDAILTDGSAGALRVLKELEGMATADFDEGDITIKWDGSPAVYFGRNKDGEFVFTPYFSLNAKNYNGKPTSQKELVDNLLRNKQDDSQQAFAAQMARAWPLAENLIPSNFKGYLKADVLYFKEPPTNKEGEYEFTPNIVTYSIPADSDIGKDIAGTQLGMAVHSAHDESGAKTGQNVNEIIQPAQGVFVSRPVSIMHTPKVNIEVIEKAKETVVQEAITIDAMFDAANSLGGMKDYRALLGRFVNDQTPDFSNMAERFVEYVENAAHISGPKTKKIVSLVEQYPQAFQAMFDVMEMIMEVKDDIIADLDSASPVKTSIAGRGQGGEGYMKRNSFKMVPRKHFTDANRKKTR